MSIASDESLDVADMAPRRRAWLPFGDSSRARRLAKIAGWLGGLALAVGVLHLLGVDVGGLVLGPLGRAHGDRRSATSWPAGRCQTLQTTLTALGWFAILRAGLSATLRCLPAGARRVRRRRRAQRLPAREHRHVRDAPDVRRDHPGRDLRRRARRMLVQKIFFTVAGTFVYVYLFAVRSRARSSAS